MIPSPSFIHRIRFGVMACVLTVLAGCVSTPSVRVPAGLDLPEKDATSDGQRLEAGIEGRQALAQTPTPTLEIHGPSVAGDQSGDTLPPMTANPASINVQDVPVPAFANEVFGNLLGLNVSMSPQVSALQDLVTLRTQARQAPDELFQLARQVLGEYGVVVSVEGDLVKLDAAVNGASTEPPLIVSGRAAPQVPGSHRPVFQLVELEVVSSNDANRWLTTLFGQELKLSEQGGARNALLINGRPTLVRQAVEALAVFDRPAMRGRISTRLEPAFMSAEELANRLVEVLNVQGYATQRGVSPSSVIVLPIVSGNAVLVFANTQQALDYAVTWARELDRPNQQAGSKSLFYYQVKNTKASELATILSGGSVSNAETSSSAAAGAAGNAGGGAAPAVATAPRAQAGRGGAASGQGNGALGDGTLQVDEPRNAIIYQGDPAQWERILTLIRQIDRAPRQVMIEVTIAEITLSNSMDSGIDWFANQGLGRFNGQMWSGGGAGGASGGGSGGPGLTWLLDVAGQTRATLNAMAQDSRVNILSNPRLMVKSGGDASMNVGDEIPTVSMTTTGGNQTGGTTNLLQSIQYRRTGVVLQIKPTVYSGNRIDLEISQEVSQASNDNPAAGTAAGAASPTIRNRSLTTTLTLTDGQTIVMGGLVSNNATNSDSGVPFLKNIPLLGHLFKSTRQVSERQELVLIIVPYIVEDAEQASALSQAVIDRFENIDLEQLPRTALPTPPATPEPAGAQP